ncbi:MAG TPA: ABC transporter substrate-binding protein [Bacteroidales bacterium]|nr:ABC transporter substrate-binding protein [Bacteroidales bacterium]
MKLNLKYSVILFLITLLPFSRINSQNDKQNYGNVPNELVGYDRYMKAYKYHFIEPLEFYGAGREKKAPTDLKEVRIGFLGPLEGSLLINLGTQMLQGSMLAIEEANSRGGYKGIPYKLMVHNDFGLWGAAANEIVKMDDEGVWAWLGTIDDINSHVALRASFKLEIPLVNTGDPDPTFTETAIPWVVRIIPDDRQSSYALVKKIYVEDGHKRVAMIRANNRYGRVGTLHFNRTATRIGYPVIIEERFDDGETEFTSQLERIRKTNPDAIALWGNAKESGLILKQLRAMGFKQTVYASDRVVSKDFLDNAGTNAEGVVTTCQYNPDANDPKLKQFKVTYQKRYNMEPDVFAAHAYDGMNIIIRSIERAGLNRALIRDVMTDMKITNGYKGVTGEVVYDGSWNNIRPIFMATVKNGKFEFYPAPKWEKDDLIYKKPASGYSADGY